MKVDARRSIVTYLGDWSRDPNLNEVGKDLLERVTGLIASKADRRWAKAQATQPLTPKIRWTDWMLVPSIGALHLPFDFSKLIAVEARNHMTTYELRPAYWIVFPSGDRPSYRLTGDILTLSNMSGLREMRIKYVSKV